MSSKDLLVGLPRAQGGPWSWRRAVVLVSAVLAEDEHDASHRRRPLPPCQRPAGSPHGGRHRGTTGRPRVVRHIAELQQESAERLLTISPATSIPRSDRSLGFGWCWFDDVVLNACSVESVHTGSPVDCVLEDLGDPDDGTKWPMKLYVVTSANSQQAPRGRGSPAHLDGRAGHTISATSWSRHRQAASADGAHPDDWGARHRAGSSGIRAPGGQLRSGDRVASGSLIEIAALIATMFAPIATLQTSYHGRRARDAETAACRASSRTGRRSGARYPAGRILWQSSVFQRACGTLGAPMEEPR